VSTTKSSKTLNTYTDRILYHLTSAVLLYSQLWSPGISSVIALLAIAELIIDALEDCYILRIYMFLSAHVQVEKN
jgi:hypothetical protein